MVTQGLELSKNYFFVSLCFKKLSLQLFRPLTLKEVRFSLIINLIFFVLLPFHSVSSVRRLAGGWSPKNINHEGVKENAKFATNVINDQSNSIHYENLIHIHEALSQVVSGVKYNITLDMGKTICRKNEVEPTKLSECTLDQQAVSI